MSIKKKNTCTHIVWTNLYVHSKTKSAQLQKIIVRFFVSNEKQKKTETIILILALDVFR